MQAIKDVQAGTRILYVICAEGKANKNITIANLVSLDLTSHSNHNACDWDVEHCRPGFGTAATTVYLGYPACLFVLLTKCRP